MTHEELLRTLGATLDRLSDLTRGLPRDRLAQRPKEGEWSVTEILDHLLVGEREVIVPRLKRMLLEEAPVFPSSASTRTGVAANSTPGDFEAALAEFCRVREETLAFLQSLRGADWQRIGTTPTRGTLTIEAYARYLAEHDLEHLAQLEATRAAVA